MSKSICQRCRVTLRQALLAQRQPTIRRTYSSEPPSSSPLDIATLLSKPTWSVRSLLPPADTTPAEEITSSTLHHLLRLSALPQPTSPTEEASMLQTLHSQLHFVRDIQSVDTEGIEPLQSLRDETAAGIRDATIGVADVRQTLEKEEFRGRNGRPRRRREGRVEIGREEGVREEGWDVLGMAGETVRVGDARLFVVRSGKGDDAEEVEKDGVKDDT